MARFELVRAIDGGPTAPNGDADLGGSSTGRSRQGSLGEKVDDNDADATLGEGLKVAAFALRNLGEIIGDPEDGSAS